METKDLKTRIQQSLHDFGKSLAGLIALGIACAVALYFWTWWLAFIAVVIAVLLLFGLFACAIPTAAVDVCKPVEPARLPGAGSPGPATRKNRPRKVTP